MQLPSGLVLGILISWLAWRARSLSTSGAFAAAVTGGLIFGLGGWPWAALLLTFFISSSALSHFARWRKAALDEKFSKGGQRDWGQVAANGGVGALLSVCFALLPGLPWLWAAFAGAMAAVNADTWATELGVLSRIPPRMITTGKPVERGASGGVTLLGYAAVLAGAALVGGMAALFTPPGERLGLALAAIVGGLAGATVDSFLGATVQAIYFCPTCQKETERHPAHTCGMQTTLRRGWRWLNNDLVNLVCSLAGALAAASLWLALFH